MTQDLPVLPYPDSAAGATSGHSGSDTSQRRAENEDATGQTRGQQRLALDALKWRGPFGITWFELLTVLVANGYPAAHHGAASRTLSNLHRADLVVRLAGPGRHNRKIYVLPEFVDGREVELPRDQRGPRGSAAVVLTADEQDAVEHLAGLADSDGWAMIHPDVAKAILALLGRLGVKP